MSDISQLAHVLRQYEVFRKGPDSQGGGDFHKGLKHLRNVDHDRVAQRVLQRNWHSRKAVASMFKMAESVERLLHLNLDWKERRDLGRLLISSLCYAGLYRLEPEDDDDVRSPYYIVRTGESLSVDHTPPTRTSTTGPFEIWHNRYDDDGNRLVKPSYPSPPSLEFDPKFPTGVTEEDQSLIMRSWYLAVHKLEATAFRINDEMLDLVIETDKREATRIIPTSYKSSKAQKELDERYKKDGIKRLEKLWNTHDKKLWQEQKKRDQKRRSQKKTKLGWRDDYRMTHDELRTLFKFWRDSKRLKEKKLSYLAKRRRFETELAKAKELRGKVFHQRIKMCYRGRMYFPADFSIQGTDFARSVIEFAEPEHMTLEGTVHLHMQAINMLGSSADIDDKKRESTNNAGQYMEIAVDPKGQFSKWKNAEKPYSFLRACLEVADYWGVSFQTKNGKKLQKKLSKYEQGVAKKILARNKRTGRGFVNDEDEISMLTHLPVELDQSNSAYQHIALLMNDKKLLRQANGGELWSDLYRLIANDEVMDRDGLTNADEKRKLIKLVAVPWGYGASERTCADDLIKFRDESPQKAPYLNTLSTDDVNDLVSDIVDLLNRSFPTCADFRYRIENLITEIEDKGKSDVISWITPSHWETVQRKHYADGEQVDIYAGPERGDIHPRVKIPTDTINWTKNKTSAPANIVHSMDASVIHMLLSWGTFKAVLTKSTKDVYIDYEGPEGRVLYPIATTHDAFHVHAPNATDLISKFKGVLEELYKINPLEAVEHQLGGRDYDPKERNIDLKHAKNMLS